MTVPAPFAHCLPVAGERPRKMPTVHPRAEAAGVSVNNLILARCLPKTCRGCGGTPLHYTYVGSSGGTGVRPA